MIALTDIPVSEFKTTPAPHQLEGVRWALNRDYGAIFDEQGSGKTKQIIDLACIRFEEEQIDTVVIICPATVRINYSDLEWGEIKTHGWVPGLISEFNSYRQNLLSPEKVKERGRLYWIITNYEILRMPGRMEQ